MCMQVHMQVCFETGSLIGLEVFQEMLKFGGLWTRKVVQQHIYKAPLSICSFLSLEVISADRNVNY